MYGVRSCTDLHEERMALRLLDRGPAVVGVEVLEVEVQAAVGEQLRVASGTHQVGHLSAVEL